MQFLKCFRFNLKYKWCYLQSYRSFTSNNNINISNKKEELQLLTGNINSLNKTLQSVVDSLRIRDKKSNFLQTKEEHLDTVQAIADQCSLVHEILEDEDTAKENVSFIESEISNIEKKIDDLGHEFYLDCEEDFGDAIIHFTAGAGGDDSCDWTSMLKNMYEKWGALHNFTVNEIETSESNVGIKSASIQIIGDCVYGWLKKETGVHRLVRISPFNAQGKRQTSFASITVVPSVNDEISVQIRPSDLRIETKRASGPGGQHVNTTDSAVRITHIPTGIVANASTKSQMMNKKLAMAVLKSRLYEREKQNRDQSSIQLKSSIDQQSWGSQIRNYVLHPYQNVIDLRTRFSCSQPQSVLDGSKLDDFLVSLLKHTSDNNNNKSQ